MRGSGDVLTGDDGRAAQTCVVAVVRGEEDVGVVQLADAVQFLHQLFHHVVHGDQRLPPAGRDTFVDMLVCRAETKLWCGRLNPKTPPYRFL